VWFAIKYRARPGRKAAYTHGNMRAEVIWTAVPAVTVIAIGLMSGGVWRSVKSESGIPANALSYRVTAKQFEWNVTYAGPDGSLDTADDFTIRNQLHVPVYRPVVVRLRAEDVIHSFFIPAFRVKQDAVPGLNTHVWFEAMETGEFDIACAELCGIGHTTMGATVTVHAAEDFDRWVASQATTTALR